MKCLDTFPLIEIAIGNEKAASLLDHDIIITDITISEFYYVILQKYNAATSDFWYKKFAPYCASVPRDVLIKAVRFRHINKKKEFSFFDCVGYIFATENKYEFVTGGKEFEGFRSVSIIKKL